MDTIEIGKKIKFARDKKNITLDDIALKVGVAKSTIQRYETGKIEKPKLPVLESIANAINVNPAWLIGKSEIMEPIKEFSQKDTYDFSLSEINHIKKYRTLDEHGKKVVDFILNEEVERMTAQRKPAAAPTRLISYFYKNASAGSGQLLLDNLPDKDIEIPDIPEYRNVSYSISVNGSSMEPLYSDGDVLLVEATQEIQIGEIGIFSVNNECYVKKVGETELISLNNSFPNIPLNETARCMGKVIGKL